MEPAHGMAALAASVASEFNDELTLLLNELTWSLDLLGQEHPASAEIAAAQRAALRCSGMTRRLLAYTQRMGPPVRPVPLETLLERP